MENVYLSLFTSRSAGSFKEKRLLGVTKGPESMTPDQFDAKTKELKEQMKDGSVETTKLKTGVRVLKIQDFLDRDAGRKRALDNLVEDLKKREDADKALGDTVDKTSNKDWKEMVKAINDKDPAKKTERNRALGTAQKLINESYKMIDELFKLDEEDRPHNFLAQVKANVEAVVKTKALDTKALEADGVAIGGFVIGGAFDLEDWYADKEASQKKLKDLEKDHSNFMRKELNPLLRERKEQSTDAGKKGVDEDIDSLVTARKSVLLEKIGSLAKLDSTAERFVHEFNTEKQMQAIFNQMKDIDTEVRKAKGLPVEEEEKEEDKKKPDEAKEKKVELKDSMKKRLAVVKEAYKVSEKEPKKLKDELDKLNKDDEFKALKPEERTEAVRLLNEVVKSEDKQDFKLEGETVVLADKTGPKAPEGAAKTPEKEKTLMQQILELLKDLIKFLQNDREISRGIDGNTTLKKLNLDRAALKAAILDNEQQLALLTDPKQREELLKKIEEQKQQLKEIEKQIKATEGRQRETGQRFLDRGDTLAMQIEEQIYRQYGIRVKVRCFEAEDGSFHMEMSVDAHEMQRINNPDSLMRMARMRCQENGFPCQCDYVHGGPGIVNMNVIQVQAGAAGDEESKKLD